MSEKKSPSVEELEAALRAKKRAGSYSRALRSTISALVVVAAVAILVAMLLIAFLRISGASMTPVISDGDIVLVLRTKDVERGDVIAFHYNNETLVKRVIALGGERVNIGSDGTVKINGAALDESAYLANAQKSRGEPTISLPYPVPDGHYFVMGDHRSTSNDSRNILIGAVPEGELLGKLLFRVWPLSKFGPIN